MTDLVEKHYTGNDAKKYNARRSFNSKWKFEEKILSDYLNKLDDSNTILDAPVGTGRFFHLYDRFNVMGLDYSEAMLEEANQIKTPNVTLKKHDLIENLVDINYDILICYRFFNLMPEHDVINSLKNILPIINIGGLITIRDIDDLYNGPTFLENKIYLQNSTRIQKCINDLGFLLENIHVYNDKRAGRYCVYEICKK